MTRHLNKYSTFSAPLNEAFFSYQGEGIYAGIPQIFVRFSGCNLRCDYCDTKKNLQIKPKSRYFTHEALYEYVSDIFNRNKEKFFNCKPSISFTGGEPLIYADFILEFLKKYNKKKFSIYVETNGTLPQQMKKIYKYCDIVAMDIKFKSACKKDYFNEHKKFIEICKNKVFIKAVITKDTTKQEFLKAINLVSDISKRIRFVIQPASNSNYTNGKIFEFYNMALAKLQDVRILPQLHKIWGIK